MVAKSRSLSSTETLLCATRYGNVMVSRGSVIPLFVSQIKAGKPLTITDPNMTRFLMSLDDSAPGAACLWHGQQATSSCRRRCRHDRRSGAGAQGAFQRRQPGTDRRTRHGENSTNRWFRARRWRASRTCSNITVSLPTTATSLRHVFYRGPEGNIDAR